MFEFFFKNKFLVINIVEIIAAIFGSYYVSKTKNSVIKIFVYYLWLTVFVEIIGAYGHLLLNNYDYQWYIDLKNSVFCENRWLYNIYDFLALGLLSLFYSNLMISLFFRRVIIGLFIFYALFAFVFFTVTDDFFLKSPPYAFLMYSVCICIFIILYFVELMRNEELIYFFKLPSFYISVALLIWCLCVTPLFIFDSYFYSWNTKFVIFRGQILLYINIFTYLCFTFGFWYSLKKSKQ